jgi:hypothetical protein
MNATELAIDGLAAQECESLAACVARGQTPDTYADIIFKLRGHAEKLPADRIAFWSDQCKALGVVLIPKSTSKRLESTKPGGTSIP